jgi:molecular chaperone DnaK
MLGDDAVKHVIGIDLGTTYSAVAYVNETGKAEIIRNDFNRPITPSLIYFGADRLVVGDEAKEQQKAGKTEIASFFKRNLDDAHFLLTFHGKSYSAIDLSAQVLSYLKAQAERHLNATVTDAVITVPAYFTHVQRQATIKAGEQAGLHVLKIIDEPTAAARGYGWQPQKDEQLVLVYDLGGGTFDVSLIAVTEHELRVLALNGDHHLGGKDWDDRVLQYLSEHFQQDCGLELSDDDGTLRVSVERVKQALTIRQSASVPVQSGPQKRTYTITRALFEELTRDLLERTQTLAESTLSSAGKQWSDIHGVLLVGGSTRMPMVRAYIEQATGKPPMTGSNPDEAVALGAALEAHNASKQPGAHAGEHKQTIDVIAHSLGTIATRNTPGHYVNSIIIAKNQPLPISRTRSFEVALRPDGQTQLEIFLTQGESDNPQQCVYLGLYVFSDFPRLPASSAIVAITYTYDSNGIVHIAAREQSSTLPLTLTVKELPSDVPARFADTTQELRVPSKPMTIYLALDLSISMDGTGLETARKALLAFIQQCDLTTISLGLISFSDAAMLNLAATKDTRTLRRAVEQLTAGRTGHGNNGHPFDEVYDALSSVEGLRHAIVLTDGIWSYKEKAIKQAWRCHTAGIEISAIGFSKADRDFLTRIASTPWRGLFRELDQLTATMTTLARELTIEAGGKVQATEEL